MGKLKNLVLTSSQIKVIEDLIDKGAVVEIIDQRTETKIIIKRDNFPKKQEIVKLFPEFYGVGINGKMTKKNLNHGAI